MDEFLMEWLGSWETDQKINGFTVPAREKIRELIIEPWQKKDGFNGDDGEKWDVRMENAPFRLLAIVNRMDLGSGERLGVHRGPDDESDDDNRTSTATGGGYGGSTSVASDEGKVNAGEGRLVFGALDPDGDPLTGDFTIIFEFKLLANDARGVADWAMDWHQLGKHRSFDAAYRENLVKLTAKFMGGSQGRLGQIRTNEASLENPRELREFAFDGERIVPDTVKQTPAPDYLKKGTKANRALADWINENESLIESEGHTLPNNLILTRRKTIPLLGGNALITANSPRFHWAPSGVRHSETRRLFSLNTCNGCHAGETGTKSVVHIKPRARGHAAELSNFLKTEKRELKIRDPGKRSKAVAFNEMGKRVELFSQLLNPELRSRDVRDILKSRARRAH